MIIVNLTLATLCIMGETPRCFNALVGNKTPIGEFTLSQRFTEQPFYGGDVLVFKEEENGLYAIHRVWNGKPSQKREERLKGDVRGRKITDGCINVEPVVYDMLVECCSDDTVRITR